MRKAIQYCVASGTSLDELEEKMLEFLQKGDWEPSGSLVIDDGTYYQPVVEWDE